MGWLPAGDCEIYVGVGGGGILEAKTAATGSSVFSVQKNSVEVATITVSASGTSGVFAATSGSTISLTDGDLVEVFGPSTADSTLADVDLTLVGALL